MPSSVITAGSAAHAERSGSLIGSEPVPLRIEKATAGAVWTVFWRSRLLVWVVGCIGAMVLGTASGAVSKFDPIRLTTSFGRVGNVLAAPAVRWDSIWYVQIAHAGYRSVRETAFYPLYPLVMRAVALIVGSLPVAGVLVSLVAMFIALVIVRRLTELDLSERSANVTIQLIACGPMAVFLSAVYTESLFLALSAGAFYAARRGRWALAGLLGGLAAATRVTGVALLVPVLLLYFYGPRSDATAAAGHPWWRPRYKVTPAVLWAALIPAGAAAFAGYLALRGYGSGSAVHAQQHILGHRFVVPVVGAWDGLVAGWHQLMLQVAGADPARYHTQSVFQSVALLVATGALVGVLRRLPIAYGAYVAVGLMIALSTPTNGDPLRGLARYESVLFPLQMWAGAWATERGVERTLVLGSCVLLVLFTAEFSTWHVVGAPFV
jgi:Mannosyltransferase (PIG-V)